MVKPLLMELLNIGPFLIVDTSKFHGKNVPMHIIGVNSYNLLIVDVIPLITLNTINNGHICNKERHLGKLISTIILINDCSLAIACLCII